MFKLLKYIIIILLGYKIFNEFFGKKKKSLSKTPQRQNVDTNKTSQTSNITNSNDKFDDAETIEYEELK